MRIVVDAMGGDNAPDAVIAAAVKFLNNTGNELILCGSREIIEEKLKAYTYDKSRLKLVDCTDIITDRDEPVKAVKSKKNASMVVAANLLSAGEAAAMLSLGNTGAVLSVGILIVGRLKGILRPAIATCLPTAKGGRLLIDAGANTNCRSENLLQFAVMGRLYMNIFNIDNPKVALINNGAEPEKGTALAKEAHKLLAASNVNFIGNIEGRDIMEGTADVMVCDGFTGNIILKTVEGVAAVLNRNLKGIFKSSILGMIGAACVKNGLIGLKKSMDYREYGGAPILGLKKLVVKGHGSSDSKAVYNALLMIERTVHSGLTEKIAEQIGE